MTITNKVSLKSVMAGVTPIADVPDAPTIGAATNVGTSRAYNNGSATVAYTAAATGGAVTTFTATSTPGSFTATGASPLTVTGLQSATSYTFAVSAANANGTLTSAASSSITATTVPQAPTIGTATDLGTGTTVSVAFTAGATGGSAITSYSVISNPATTTQSASSSPYTFTGLTAGTAYTFTVTATNANGTSTASSASNSVTPVIPTYFEQLGSNNANLNKIRVSSGNKYAAGLGLGNQSGAVVFNSDGSVNTAWSITAVSNTSTQGTAALVDSSGNLYFTGSWRVVSTPYQEAHAVVTKVNSSGTLVWAKSWQVSAQTTVGNALDVDSSGNVYSAGYYYDSGNKFFIGKHNSSGTKQWQNGYYSGVSTTPGDIKIDSAETSIYVTGATNYLLFLAKYNTSGTLQWSNNVTSPNIGANGSSLAIDSTNGYVYVGGGGPNSSSVNVGWIGQFSIAGSGSLNWQRSLTEPNGTLIANIRGTAVDSSGNVYVSGVYYANSNTDSIAFVAKYNSSGTIQWQRKFESPNTSGSYNRTISFSSIAVDNDGSLILTGQGYQSTGDITSKPILIKYPTDGSKTGTYSFTYSGNTYQVAISSSSLTTATPTWSVGSTSFTTVANPTGEGDETLITPQATSATVIGKATF